MVCTTPVVTVFLTCLSVTVPPVALLQITHKDSGRVEVMTLVSRIVLMIKFVLTFVKRVMSSLLSLSSLADADELARAASVVEESAPDTTLDTMADVSTIAVSVVVSCA